MGCWAVSWGWCWTGRIFRMMLEIKFSSSSWVSRSSSWRMKRSHLNCVDFICCIWFIYRAIALYNYKINWIVTVCFLCMLQITAELQWGKTLTGYDNCFTFCRFISLTSSRWKSCGTRPLKTSHRLSMFTLHHRAKSQPSH